MSDEAPAVEPSARAPWRGAAFFVVACLTVWVLAQIRDLLIPLVLAVFFWFLITNLKLALRRVAVGGRRLPEWAAFAVSLLLIGLLTLGLVELVRDNVTQVIDAAPQYQRNLEAMLDQVVAELELEEQPDLLAQIEDVDLAGLISRSASALANLLGNAGLVAVYVFFLFVEERYFDAKLRALFPDRSRRRQIDALLARIGADTRAYIGLKTLVSLMTALPSYAILLFVGLDFAEFWTILIFVLNFIPNIGSLVATALPSLLALVQFDNLRPFLVVAGGVLAVQLFVANVLEPRLMGRSLNLSPLVIILSLVVWGTLWGVAGMFLCVPMTVVLMIVLSYFPQTRPIAVLLSEDGRVTEA